MTEERINEIIEMVKTDYMLISKMYAPEKEIQLAAVKTNIDAIYHIHGGLDESVLQCIDGYIDNIRGQFSRGDTKSTYELYRMIMKSRGYIIFAKYNTGFTFAQYCRIIKEYPRNIRFVNRKKLVIWEYTALCVIAIKTEPSCYRLIKEFISTQELDDLAITLDPNNIKYATFEINPITQLLVVNTNPDLFEYIKDPIDITKEVKEALGYF